MSPLGNSCRRLVITVINGMKILISICGWPGMRQSYRALALRLLKQNMGSERHPGSGREQLQVFLTCKVCRRSKHYAAPKTFEDTPADATTRSTRYVSTAQCLCAGSVGPACTAAVRTKFQQLWRMTTFKVTFIRSSLSTKSNGSRLSLHAPFFQVRTLLRGWQVKSAT